MQSGDLLANRFLLEAPTGSGGSAQVFRARDTFSASTVAVKVLRERRDGWDQRFLREAEVLAGLHHPAIVRHVAHGACAGGQRYLVMEWLEGEDLAARLARGPLGLEGTLALARRVADALAVAHARGVVHRDLKPANLWLVDGEPARVKVLDFGIASLQRRHARASEDALSGTPGYMAPEQVRGAFDIDARADVFALGCVLHECLSGQALFRSGHVIGLLAKILLEPVGSLRATLPSVPVAVDALLSQMLAKSRELRPADGAEVRRALDALSTHGAPATVSVPGALSRAERRTVTLLLVGSGVRSDGSTPEFRHGTPGTGEQSVREVVRAHGGTLEQLADDTAIVSFSDADVATDRAARAARCALALVPLCAQRPLALVTGRGELSEHAPLGAAIDRATATLSRISGERRGGPIWIDDLTANLLDARFVVTQGAHGLALSRERELVGAPRRLLGKATACVGRDFELSALRAAFDDCVRQKAARAMLISARAGIGKSRLAAELVERLRRDHPELPLWITRGDPLRTGSAFGLIEHLLRPLFALRDDDPPELRRASIGARVAVHVPVSECARVASFLGELLGVPFDERDDGPLREARGDAHEMNQQLSRAFVDFVRAELRAGPLLWILEDLHWGDLPSMRFVDAALSELSELPWLVLGLARPELFDRTPRLWAERGISVMHLRPLTPRAAERLVAQALGGVPSPAQVARVVELAGGNAFYLEELTRTLGAGEGALPDTVLSMIEHRLGSLERDQQRVLRAASLFGEACWESALLPLVGGGIDPKRLHHCVSQLIEQELLVARADSRFAGEREFTFRHALLREGAYAQLTEEDRRLGHRSIADWLEQRGEPSAAVLALHLERGGELARAGKRYVTAAQDAHLGADYDAVLLHARAGLRCGVPDALARVLHGLIVMVLGARSDIEAARAHLDAVAQLTPADGSLTRSYQLLPVMVRALQGGSDAELVPLCDMLDGVLSVPLSDTALDVFGAVVGWCTFELAYLGHFELARGLGARYRQQLAPFVQREPSAAGWLGLSETWHCMVFQDEPARGLSAAKRTLQTFVQARNPSGSAVVQTFIGWHAQSLGLLEEAADALRAARGIEIGTLGTLRDLMHVLSLLDRDAIDEAEAETVGMLGRTRRRHRAERGRASWAAALVSLRRGDTERCLVALERARAQLVRWPLEHVTVQLVWATAELARGRAELGLERVELADRELRALVARGYGGSLCRRVPIRHAELLAACGRNEEAARKAAHARDLVQAAAARIEDPALRESFLTRVPLNASALRLAARYET